MMKRTGQISDGEFWADKLMDLANLEIIVLVFGQFVGLKRYWPAALFGIILYILLIVISRKLRKE